MRNAHNDVMRQYCFYPINSQFRSLQNLVVLKIIRIWKKKLKRNIITKEWFQYCIVRRKLFFNKNVWHFLFFKILQYLQIVVYKSSFPVPVYVLSHSPDALVWVNVAFPMVWLLFWADSWFFNVQNRYSLDTGPVEFWTVWIASLRCSSLQSWTGTCGREHI